MEAGRGDLAPELDGQVVGVGALKRLDDDQAELKSMHTIEAARGRGVGAALVDAGIEQSRVGNHVVRIGKRRQYRQTLRSGDHLQTAIPGDELSLTVASCVDPGVVDTHFADIHWGDGAVTQGIVSATGRTYSWDGVARSVIAAAQGELDDLPRPAAT